MCGATHQWSGLLEHVHTDGPVQEESITLCGLLYSAINPKLILLHSALHSQHRSNWRRAVLKVSR